MLCDRPIYEGCNVAFGSEVERLRASTSSPLFSTSTHLELDDAALIFTHACKLG